MHRCLAIGELIYNICENFHPDTDLAAIHAAALTCKAWQNPALDVLWRTMNDILPLLRCLPKDLWREESIMVDFKTITSFKFVRPIQPKDWESAAPYARRIKHLFQASDAFDCQNPLEQLRALFPPGTSMLPSVERLQLIVKEKWFLSCATMFLGSRLKHLHCQTLAMQEESGNTLPLTLAAKAFCPKLRRIEFYSHAHDEDETRVLSEVILGLEDVRVIRINALTTEALAHTAQLPYLTTMSLLHMRGGPIHFPYSVQPFPFLTCLVLRLDVLEPSFSVLKLLKDAPLRKVCISCKTPSSQEHWKEFFVLAGEIHRRQRLMAVEFGEILTDPSPMRTQPIHLGEIISPMFKVAGLKSFTFSPARLSVCDSTLQDIASAWPLLTDLQLYDALPTSTLISEGRPTLLGLLPLVKFCPNFSNLAMHLNTRGSHAAVRMLSQATPVCANPVELWFCDSIVEDALSVANFLSVLFPEIESITSYHPHRDEWAKVEMFCEEMSLARLQHSDESRKLEAGARFMAYEH